MAMFTYSSKVDIGVYEEQNDDRAIVGPIILTDGEISGDIQKNHVIACICDGVGGLAHGNRAAMITLEVMSHLNRSAITSADILSSIEIANQRIRYTQSIENLQDGLRSTIAGIYADENRCYVFNAGDSRVYRFRYKYFTQLSKDHSLVQDMVDLGEITPDEARFHPQKNIINKCLGNDETVNPRIIDYTDDFLNGDIILICSDGLTDEVSDSELKEIILKHKQDKELNACCLELYNNAIEKGSKDNISLILLRKDV